MPRVSIGLPVYNGERYLEQAIASFLAQTFTDFELVISDNASTDNTAEICLRYAERDQRIRYVRQTKNHGAATNYNYVFANSTGEYFKWAAHDDYCAPTYLEACVKVLDAEPDVVLAYSKACVIDETGKRVADFEDNFHLMAPHAAERLRCCFLAGSWVFQPVFGLIRRRVLARTPLIANYVGADLSLLVYLAVAGKCYEVPERLFYRREHLKRSGNLPLDEFARWWNPANQAAVYFPYWRRLREYFVAVARSSLPLSERYQCAVHVLRWAHWHRPLLLRDITHAVAKGPTRLVRSKG